jgi:hypothetical protein
VRRPSKNRACALTIAAIVLAAGEVLAAPPRLETPPDVEGCPPPEDLRRAIVTQLGRDAWTSSDAPDVTVRVRRAGDALAAEIVLATKGGGITSRTIVDPAGGCPEIVRASALAVALAIEQEAAAPPPRKEPEPSPSDRDAAPSGPGITSDRVVVTAAALTSIGLLPRPSAGAGLAVRARLAGTTWLSARGIWQPEGTMPNDAFAMRALAAGAGICSEPFASGNAALVGCGHLVAGELAVTTTSSPLMSSRSDVYLAASLSAGARARIRGPLSVEAMVDAHLPFTRPTFLAATCPPTGFEPPFVAVLAWLGAGVSFR